MMGSFPFAATFCVSCATRVQRLCFMYDPSSSMEFLPGGAGQLSYILQIWAITKVERDNKKCGASIAAIFHSRAVVLQQTGACIAVMGVVVLHEQGLDLFQSAALCLGDRSVHPNDGNNAPAGK